MGEHETDVLVIGGGPAGIWSAVSAVAAGARVTLVDKSRCGASGPTAFGTTSLWDLPPGRAREDAVHAAYVHGGHLGDTERIRRMFEEAHRRLGQLASWGYHLRGGPGNDFRLDLDGASYLRRMRARLLDLGVRVLDHHPALQLLTDADGVVAGASGVRRGDRHRPWTVRAGAVIVATGGCAFLSGGAGTDVATGEGLLLAVEAGAELSGMEFSSAYGLVPVSSVPAGGHAGYAPGLGLEFPVLYDEAGEVLPGRGDALTALAAGHRVLAHLDDLGEATRVWLHRQGAVDPRGRVSMRAVLLGTVRGTGGLRIAPDCSTTVPGLFAVGDAASREAITGATSGFGGQDGAWAIASGGWAGVAAAGFARDTRVDAGRDARPVPGAGLHHRAGIDPRAVIGLVQEHTLPMRRSFWRNENSLRHSIAELDAMWPGTVYDLGGQGAQRLRARQAAAMLAVARWTKYSALARTESRGMHRRTDHPEVDAAQAVRLRSGGLGQVWVRTDARASMRTDAYASMTGDACASGAGDDACASVPVDGLDPGIRRTSGQESVLALPPRPPSDVEIPEADTRLAGQESVLAHSADVDSGPPAEPRPDPVARSADPVAR